MMMVAARGKKNGAVSDPLHDLKSQNPPVKPERPFQVCDLQMDMADPHRRVSRVGRKRMIQFFRKSQHASRGTGNESLGFDPG